MRMRVRSILMFLLVLLVSSCSTTKFVPQDKYLLRKVHVRIHDRKEVNDVHRSNETALDADALASKMSNYVRQKSNSEILGFWPLQLQVYSLAGRDSTRWINRQLMKMGEAPEVFDPSMAQQSCTEITKAMFNKGYFNATVDTMMSIRKRRLYLTYDVTARQPYTVRSYTVRLDNPELRAIAKNEKTTLVHEGMLFDADELDQERERITKAMRARGYYYFEKDYLKYEADSSYTTNEVTLSLRLQDYVQNAPDSMREQLFTRYIIRNVHFCTDFDPAMNDDSLLVHTRTRDGYSYSYIGKKLIRESVLRRSCAIMPGHYYNAYRVDRTYSDLNMLGPVKFVDIKFEEATADSLDCIIIISKGKLNSVSAEIEGTYSAGDWGIATGVGYTNRNLFRGAEELNVNGSFSYEWRQQGGRAIEGKAEASIRFPNAPKVSVGYKYQKRPDEFTRTVANAQVSYQLKAFGRKLTHNFNFFDLSYVYLPWISDEFRETFLQPTNILRYSYEDHFILDWSYAGTWSNYNQRYPYRSYATFSYQLETAGNLLYGLSYLFHQTPDEDGSFRIFNIRYSQYAKADFNFSAHHIFSKNHRLVYHGAIGVAIPFGNASSIPFEKRYFAGGANSVRGWTARTLGPGGYRGIGNRTSYNNQVGDIKLDLNLEYRWHIWSIIELAAFTDAGNVWTVRDYESQPYGVFRWNEFYKQIAWSYGIGVRLDFSFFIFRLDMGCKLYDPSRIYTDGTQWRTVPNGLCWKDDFALHFAIGYPF